MAKVTVLPVPPLDSDLTTFLTPYVARWQAAALDVAGASSPAGGWSARSTEHAVVARTYLRLPAARRAVAARRAAQVRASSRAMNRIDRLAPAVPAGSPRRRSALGDRSPEQFARLLEQFVVDNDLRTHSGEQITFDSLELNLLKVRCVDETNGFGGSEWGSDEIELGGFAVGPAVQSHVAAIPVLNLGSYDDGTVRSYSPARRLATLPLGTDPEYPKRYFVTILLVESDGGDFRDFMQDVIAEVRKFVDSIWVEIAAFLVAGLAGLVTALVYTWIAVRILDAISWLWADDHFPAQQFEIAVQSPAGATGNGEQVISFRGPGEYLVRIGWRLVDAPPARPHREPPTPPGGQPP